MGVATMRQGEKCLLTCMPEYAYGESGSPPKIPGNATLQFEVELFGWSGKDITDDGGVLMSVINKPNKYSPKPTEGARITGRLCFAYLFSSFLDFSLSLPLFLSLPQ